MQIAKTAAQGLAYLHDETTGHQQVIYRDFKASNILLAEVRILSSSPNIRPSHSPNIRPSQSPNIRPYRSPNIRPSHFYLFIYESLHFTSPIPSSLPRSLLSIV